MSDTSGAFPPPPPGSFPSPTYQPAPSPLPNYQPPPVSNLSFQPPPALARPWEQPPPPAGGAWGIVGILAQFEPPAMWSILVGLATVLSPFFFGIYFIWLPVVGAVMGFRAIAGGQLIGGLVGIGLSVVGGLLTIGLFVARLSSL